MLAVMRWLVNFIVSVGLMCAGLYVLYEELFISYSGIHGRYRPFGLGLALLDCLGPFVLKKILEHRPDHTPTGQG
jgi:hypothetical protein